MLVEAGKCSIIILAGRSQVLWTSVWRCFGLAMKSSSTQTPRSFPFSLLPRRSWRRSHFSPSFMRNLRMSWSSMKNVAKRCLPTWFNENSLLHLWFNLRLGTLFEPTCSDISVPSLISTLNHDWNDTRRNKDKRAFSLGNESLSALRSSSQGSRPIFTL